MEVKERIAYLRGLLAATGAGERPGNEAWEHLLAICDGLADALAAARTEQEETQRYVEAVDADLCEVEDELFGDETHEEPGEADFVEVECPHCGEEVCFEEGFLYDEEVEVSCPECGAVIYKTGADGRAQGDPATETENGNRSVSPTS